MGFLCVYMSLRVAVTSRPNDARLPSQDGYGTYTAVIENTSDYTFEDVSLLLSLYDADDVKTEALTATVKSWAPGEKVKFTCVSSVADAQRIEAVADYFTTK